MNCERVKCIAELPRADFRGAHFQLARVEWRSDGLRNVHAHFYGKFKWFFDCSQCQSVPVRGFIVATCISSANRLLRFWLQAQCVRSPNAWPFADPHIMYWSIKAIPTHSGLHRAAIRRWAGKVNAASLFYQSQAPHAHRFASAALQTHKIISNCNKYTLQLATTARNTKFISQRSINKFNLQHSAGFPACSMEWPRRNHYIV